MFINVYLRVVMSILYTIEETLLRDVVTVDDISNSIVVHVAKCPFCDNWHNVSYSYELMRVALREHCLHEHRAELVVHMNTVIDTDELMLHNLQSMPYHTIQHVLNMHVHPKSVLASTWPRMYDLVRVIA